MEDETACDICFNEFEASVTIPKILNCGHSFCLSCVTNLIKSKNNCPTCRKELDANKKADDYPTNYYVFSAKNMVKNESIDLPAVKSRINALKDIFLSRKKQISRDLDETNFYLTQLKSLINEENEVIDLKTSLQVLDKLESESKSVKLSGFSRLRDLVSLRIMNYKNPHDFLTEIYRKLQKNETVYAVKNVGDDVKYGKVSCQGDMILFHALSETETPDKSSLIWFDDLKLCATQDYFFTFLKLSCDKKSDIIRLLTIKMFDTRMATIFIALCTGECGLGYKGLHYEKCGVQKDNCKGILMSKSFNDRHIYLKNMLISYNAKNSNTIKRNKGDLIMCGSLRSFELYRLLQDSLLINAVGKVESPLHIEEFISFENESKLIIIDSGIAMKI